MFCNYCGASNPDDARYCNGCGRALAQQQTPRQTGSPSRTSPRTEETSKRNDSQATEATENYESTYSRMLDDELLHLSTQTKSLTEMARDALDTELRKRGLEQEKPSAYQQESASPLPAQMEVLIRKVRRHQIRLWLAVSL